MIRYTTPTLLKVFLRTSAFMTFPEIKMPVASLHLQRRELLQIRALSAVETKVRNFGVPGNSLGFRTWEPMIIPS